MTGLQGKTCLITGGAGSIGRASAALFLDQGAKVALVDRDAAALERAAASLEGKGEVLRIAADVADEGGRA